MRNFLRKNRFIALLAILGFFTSSKCLADSELSLGLGLFNIEAENSSGSDSLTNWGQFKFTYAVPLTTNIVFWPGYTVYIPGGNISDLGHGLDIEFAYFPMSLSQRYNGKNSKGTWLSYDGLRPFLSASFNLRSYQSIQSEYAGIGLGGGAEYQSSPGYFFFGKIAYLILSGPLDATLNEFQATLGAGFYLED